MVAPLEGMWVRFPVRALIEPLPAVVVGERLFALRVCEFLSAFEFAHPRNYGLVFV